MELGRMNTLKVLRETSVGLFLGDEKGNDVLLPKKFVPQEAKIDDELEVLLYLDSDERLTATTQIPEIVRDSFAFLEVAVVSDIGAFMYWNIDKQLFIPFQEQKNPMREGEYHLVHMFLDEQTNRLVGSSKWERFIDKDISGLKDLDEVNILVLGESPLGYNCIVNDRFVGLAYKNENFMDIGTGLRTKAYIKQIRKDGKLDLILEKPGLASMEKHASKILNILRKNGGFLAFHDKSDAKEVQEQLQMSKKAFKRAIGILYRQKLIELADNGIKLLK
jgi:uncharacterized protein